VNLLVSTYQAFDHVHQVICTQGQHCRPPQEAENKVFLSVLSDVNGFDVIRPETCGTCWALAVATFSNSLYTGVAEQVVAFCNNNLKETKKSIRTIFNNNLIKMA